MTRQIIQIATIPLPPDVPKDVFVVVALCNDGTVWSIGNNTENWGRIKDIPQPEDEVKP